MKDIHKIDVDYYIGSTGPCIRISVPSEELLVMLKDLFQQFAEGSLHKYEFHNVSCIHLVGLKNLELKRVSHNWFSRKTVEIVDAKNTFPEFSWSNSSEGWDECVDLIDGLLESATPCHQYLSEEGIDDALIILAYRES